MRVDTVEQFTDALDEIALNSPEATFYHTGAWLRSLSVAFPALRLRCLVARGRSEVLGYLPFFLSRKGPLEAAWSLPFGTYGGPVGRGDEEVLRTLAAAYGRLCKRLSVHEVGIVDFSNRVEIPAFHTDAASTHVIALSEDFADTWEKAFHKSKRRQVRKALKEGLCVFESRSPEEVSSYYAIYRQRIADWKERFRYPERLFVELLARGGEGVGFFVARRGDEMLGGQLNFYFKDSAIMWNGVARDTADGTHASTLLYAECIRHACENGYRSYNLGGSLGKRSLVDYKESLGGVPYGYRTIRWRSPVGKAAAAVKNIASKR
jgi:hypothetical protein